MKPPTLQEAIDKAGSPMHLLWKPNPETRAVPVVQPEYAGWRQEQAAWRDGVSIAEMSYHMWDLFIDGPDSLELLSSVSANDYQSFAIGQCKQFVPVTEAGHIITDGMLMRTREHSFTLTGVPAAQNWVAYHAQSGDYDVECTSDPDSSMDPQRRPRLFRLQIQGPQALDLVETAFGGPLPRMKFLHSAPVSLAGRSITALRHGMSGQLGYEFIGDYDDREAVKDALITAGSEFGLVHIGGKAYFTNGIESGWIPTPTPGIYTDPGLAEYRSFVSLFSFEGMRGLNGSLFSPNVEDYYVSPYELGYGRSIKFNHDFIGREALERAHDEGVPRKRVTLVFETDDVNRVFGADHDFILSYARYRIESSDALVGMTFYTAFIDPVGTILSLVLINSEYAEPGTRVEVVWGEHPGHGTDPDADLGFPRLRATVAPSPYNEFARTTYRRN